MFLSLPCYIYRGLLYKESQKMQRKLLQFQTVVFRMGCSSEC